MSNLDERSDLDRDELEVDGEEGMELFDDDSVEQDVTAAETSSERARNLTAARSEQVLDAERSLREGGREVRLRIR